MFCESYREALSEAALVGGRPPARISAHLALCAGCREAFAEEQALLRQIDAGVRSAVDMETPDSLIPGVRGRIRDLAASGPGWRLVLAYATAAAVAAGMAILLGMRGKEPQAPPETPSASTSPASEGAVAAGEAPRAQARGYFLTAEPRRAAGRLQGRRRRPEVLISGEDQIGLDKYVASLREAAGANKAKLKEEVLPEIIPIEIAEMDTKRLSIEPLESGHSN